MPVRCHNLTFNGVQSHEQMSAGKREEERGKRELKVREAMGRGDPPQPFPRAREAQLGEAALMHPGSVIPVTEQQ